MDKLKKEQIKAIVIASICIVLGILFCIMPVKILGIVETIVCVALLLYGVVSIVIYCLAMTETRDPTRLFLGAAATALAVLIIFVKYFFIISLGLIIVLSGVIYLKSAVDDKKKAEKNWWIGLIVGIFLIVAGVLVAVLCWTTIAASIVMRIFGVTLILDGVIRLIYVFAIRKEISKLFRKNEKGQLELNEKALEEKEKQDAEKVQKIEKNKEKSVKIQEKTENNAENETEVVAEAENEDDGDNTEGFV